MKNICYSRTSPAQKVSPESKKSQAHSNDKFDDNKFPCLCGSGHLYVDCCLSFMEIVFSPLVTTR